MSKYSGNVWMLVLALASPVSPWSCTCRGSTLDPTGPVREVATVSPGSLILSDCFDRLEGDDSGASSGGAIVYAMAPESGEVTRWRVGLPSAFELSSPSTTQELWVKSGDNGADQVLEVFAPDGGSHPVASKLDYHPVRVSADGLHWVEEKIVDLADGGHATAAVTHRADGSVGAPIDLPGIVDQASFPSPAGDSVIAVVGNRVRLVGAAGDRQLFDRDVYVLRQAAWDSAGTSVLLLLAPLVAGGLAGPKELWEIDLSSFTSHAIHLPPRPPVGVVASHLGEKTLPSEVMAAAWSPSGRRMALLTNHETECWQGRTSRLVARTPSTRQANRARSCADSPHAPSTAGSSPGSVHERFPISMSERDSGLSTPDSLV